MINTVYFQEANLNYARPWINRSEHENFLNNIFSPFKSDNELINQSNQVKSNGKNPTDMMEDDLILCSSTVLGFSYGNKL